MSNKEDLKPEINYSVRASQAVLQYGAGAMVNFPEQVLVTAKPEMWERRKKPITDERLAKFLHVDGFMAPIKIAYARFPEWYFCPKCRNFKPIKDWISDHKRMYPNSSDKNMIRHLKCPMCNQKLVPSRFVTVCTKGHLNDFPWIEWVHKRSNKSVCPKPKIKITTSTFGGDDLSSITLECTECKAKTTLEGIFNKDAFTKLGIKCEGNHPFKGEKEGECDEILKALPRGSSSVYFPVVYTSLVIPPYADKITQDIEDCPYFEDILDDINEADDRTICFEDNIIEWQKRLSKRTGINESLIKEILKRKLLTPLNSDSWEKYRYDEYLALTGKIEKSEGSFSIKKMSVNEYDIPHLKSVQLVDKVRIVNAHIGFSRLNPVYGEDHPGFVSIKDKDTRLYPAYEVSGEGIFIEFDKDEINTWVHNNPVIQERVESLRTKYKKSLLCNSVDMEISPKLVLLHTISHLMIKELSFECGYSIASLSERLYCSDTPNGEMTGIFIYTACGDSEGTLGGLVRQGYPDTLPRIFRKAIISAVRCSNDPVCILSKGQGFESLNLAACHSCTLLPETSCELRNSFLDRALISGTFENGNIGFWSELIQQMQQQPKPNSK